MRRLLARRERVVLQQVVPQDLLGRLRRYTNNLTYNDMATLTTQPDGKRRHRLIEEEEPLHRKLCDFCTGLLSHLRGQYTPAVQPSIVVTETGAGPQQRHADLPTDDSYAAILAIDPRRVHFTGQPDAVLERAGDVVVFDARLCHGGAGREHGGTRGASGAGPPDKRHVFGAHVYAGTGVRNEDGPRPHPPHRMQPSERRPGRRLGQGRRARQSSWRGEDRGQRRVRDPRGTSAAAHSAAGVERRDHARRRPGRQPERRHPPTSGRRSARRRQHGHSHPTPPRGRVHPGTPTGRRRRRRRRGAAPGATGRRVAARGRRAVCSDLCKSTNP